MSVSAASQLKSLLTKREKINAEITEATKKLLRDETASLFEEFPNIVRFAWTQYTPYFNDGDECVFRCHHDTPYVVFAGNEEEDDEECEFSEYNYSDWDDVARKYVPKTQLTEEEKAGKAVIDMLAPFEDSDFKQIFGDHVKVIITREGVEVEEYSHD